MKNSLSTKAELAVELATENKLVDRNSPQRAGLQTEYEGISRCNQVTVRLGNNGHAHALRMQCSI